MGDKKDKKEKKEKKDKHKEKKIKKEKEDKKEKKKRQKNLVEEAKKFLLEHQKKAGGGGSSTLALISAASTDNVPPPASWSGWGKPGGEKPWEGAGASVERETEERRAAWQQQKLVKERWKANAKLELEEMLPKATGREAQMEKKVARRQEAKEREASPDMGRLYGGGDIMGGDDSFAAAKARMQHSQQRRNQRQNVHREKVEDKADVARAREEARMAPFRALLAGGSITIPKREPN